MRKVLLAAAAVLVGLIVGGCGVAAKPAPTLAQFAAQANEVCNTLSEEQAAVAARWARGFPAHGVGETEWIDLEHVAREADAKIQGLPRPPAQDRAIEQLMQWYGEELGYEVNYASAAEVHNVLDAEVAYRAFIADAKRNASAARRLGMSACAKIAPESRTTSVPS